MLKHFFLLIILINCWLIWIFSHFKYPLNFWNAVHFNQTQHFGFFVTLTTEIQSHTLFRVKKKLHKNPIKNRKIYPAFLREKMENNRNNGRKLNGFSNNKYEFRFTSEFQSQSHCIFIEFFFSRMLVIYVRISNERNWWNSWGTEDNLHFTKKKHAS